MENYRLHCLGQPFLEVDGEPIKLEMRKSLALLVYLCMGEHDYPRESLAALFWPEYNHPHTQTNLRRALSSLNQSLPGGLIKADREKIGLVDSLEIWTDVREFEILVSTAKNQLDDRDSSLPESLHLLKEADQLYRGDFLEGFNLGDCSEFTEWQVLQCESLRRDFSWVLQKSAEACKANSDWEQSITYALRWIALDPFNEPAQRFLMDLYGRAGQRNAALKQYDALARMLQDELGQKPEAETTEFYQRIRDGLTVLVSEQPAQTPKEVPVHPLSEPILKTKLYIPSSRGKKVLRQRIIQDLNQIERYSLAVISAPAGFGKTTLLTQWASQSALLIGWYSLDSGDNEVVRFYKYLCAAIESIQPGISGDAQSLLRNAQSTPPQLVLTYLIHGLENLKTPSVLVLDDYQFITSPAIHDAVNKLLEYLPPNLHLIIATRADPPLGLARLRMNGQLLEMRVQDLRFTAEESFEFLSSAMRLPLTEEDITLLDQRIEGWAVGYQMAAIALQSRLSLKDRREIDRFIQTFSGSHRYILDYLTEEVLSRQPKIIHEFLLKTSILERLSSPVCDAIFGKWEENGAANFPFPISSEAYSEAKSEAYSEATSSQLAFESGQQIGSTPLIGSAQQILEYLERFNLFITALDDERCWYRYHHLFADLLRARLEQAVGEKGVAGLHQRASQWYEKKGLMGEAIHHALSANDTERAARLIERSADKAWLSGEFYQVLHWIEALPKELMRSHPWLSVWYVWSRIQAGSGVAGMEALIDDAEREAASSGLAQDEAFTEQIAALRVTCAGLQYDTCKTIELARRALERPAAGHQASSLMARANVLNVLGFAYYMRGELDQAEQVYGQARIAARQSDFVMRELLIVHKLALMHQVMGRLFESYRLCQEALTQLQEQGRQTFFAAGYLYCDLGHLLLEWNRFDEAEQMITRSAQLNELAQVPHLTIDTCNARARLFLAQGNLDAAQTALEQASDLIQKHYCWPEVVSANQCYQVRLWLVRGDLASAARWAEGCRPVNSERLEFSQEMIEIAHARVLLAQGLLDKALCLLGQLAGAARAGGRTGSLVEVLELQALGLSMLLARGERQITTSSELDVLKESLALARSEGFVRLYINEGPSMAALLRQAAARGIEPEYVQKLLDAFQGRVDADRSQANGIHRPSDIHTRPDGLVEPEVRSAKNIMIEPLSERELEVLQLMAKGLSNQEIAERLVVASGTVKVHIHNICGKLGVRNRTQAILLAQQLDLLA